MKELFLEYIPKMKKGELARELQIFDDFLVRRLVVPFEELQMASALGHHFDEAAARVIVFLVNLQVVGQFLDPL